MWSYILEGGLVAVLGVVLDTCVLLPAALRDTLLRAAAAGMYRPLWTSDILQELERNLQEDIGLTKAQTSKLRSMMEEVFPEAAIEGYHGLIEGMRNHPKDRHVLAAAVSGGGRVIVTGNLRHFPPNVLSPLDIEAQSPDHFLLDLLHLYPSMMLTIIHEQAADLINPPRTFAELVAELGRGAPRFAARISELHRRSQWQSGRTSGPSRLICRSPFLGRGRHPRRPFAGRAGTAGRAPTDGTRLTAH
jgi:predicted nucleic acid-binding protein